MSINLQYDWAYNVYKGTMVPSYNSWVVQFSGIILTRRPAYTEKQSQHFSQYSHVYNIRTN